MVAKPKPKTKPKKPSRQKPFRIYARFESLSTGKSTIEVWQGKAKSMASAFRKAVTIIWNRPTVRWKHYAHVTFSCLPEWLEKGVKP